MSEDQNKKCACHREGLAILPVRYCAVPKQNIPTMASWANLERIKSVNLGADYQYQTRSMRAGLIYLYYPNADLYKWECYSVDEAGNYFLQNNPKSPEMPDPATTPECYACPVLVNDSTANTVITIKNPETTKTVYMAFSEFPWSEETRQRYEKSPDQRMQKIDLTQGTQNSATTATLASIQEILDYNPNFSDVIDLPYELERFKRVIDNNTNLHPIHTVTMDELYPLVKDKKTFAYSQECLVRNNSIYPWSIGYIDKAQYINVLPTDLNLFQKEKDELKEPKAQKILKNLEKLTQSGSPLIVALDDSIGIAKELNAYYNQSYYKYQRYTDELEQVFHARNNYQIGLDYMLLKEMSEDLAYPRWEDHPYIQAVREHKGIPEAETNHPWSRPRNQLSVLIHKELAKKYKSHAYLWYFRVATPDNPYVGENSYGSGILMKTKYGIEVMTPYFESYESTSVTMNAIKAEYLNQYHHNLTAYRKNERTYEQDKEALKAKLAKRYHKKIDDDKEKAFNQQDEQLQKAAAALGENRVKALITWLKSDSFYQSCQDYNGNNMLDVLIESQSAQKYCHDRYELEGNKLKVSIEGIGYNLMIAECVKNLELSEAGRAQIEIWSSLEQLKNQSYDQKENFLWSALVYNNQSQYQNVQELFDQIKTMDNEPEVLLTNIEKVLDSEKIEQMSSLVSEVQALFDLIIEKDDHILNKIKGYNRTFIYKLAQKSIASLEVLTKIHQNLLAPAALSGNRAIVEVFSYIFIGLGKTAIKGTLLSLKMRVSYNSYKLKTTSSSIAFSRPTSNSNSVTNIKNDSLRRQELIAKLELIAEKQNKLAELKQSIDLKEKQLLKNFGENDYQRNMAKARTGDVETRNKIYRAGADLIIMSIQFWNYYSIIKAQKDEDIQEFFTKEIAQGTLALATTGAILTENYLELMKGESSKLAKSSAALSGALGSVLGIWMAVDKMTLSYKEMKEGNSGRAAYNFVFSLLYTFNAAQIFYQGVKTLKIGTTIAGYAERRGAISFLAFLSRGLISTGWLTVIGILLLLGELVWSMIADDDFEDWIERTPLGTLSDDSDAYYTINDQEKDFKKAFGLDHPVIKENQNPVVLDDDYNEYHALTAIYADLKAQGIQP